MALASQLLDDQGLTDALIARTSPKLFHPYRILILKILAAHGEVEFRELKHDLKLTDGNLAAHLGVLVHLGYLKPKKEIVGRKLRTSYVMTDEGLKALRDFARTMRRVISLV